MTVVPHLPAPPLSQRLLPLRGKHRGDPIQADDWNTVVQACLSILEILHAGFGDPKYRPCPLLRRMVDAGHLGRKSGRGFYEYGPEGAR